MRFEIMREAILDLDLGGFRPALLWVYDPSRPRVSFHPVHTAFNWLVLDYETEVTDALSRGFSWREIWEHWGRKGGDNYTRQRTAPIVTDYLDMATLVDVELAIMRDSLPPLRRPETGRAIKYPAVTRRIGHLPGKHDQKDHGKRHAPVISITVGHPGKQKIGVMADLRTRYPASEPGRDHLRPLRVMVTKGRLDHIVTNPKDGPLRAKLLSEKAHLVRKAIESPELGRRHLELAKDGHWRHTIAVKDPDDPKHYVVVALSLARLPGEKHAKEHRVITVYLSREREFYRGGEIRTEWMELRTNKPAMRQVYGPVAGAPHPGL